MKPNAFVASYKGPFPTSNHIDDFGIFKLEILVEKASNWKVLSWKVLSSKVLNGNGKSRLALESSIEI